MTTYKDETVYIFTDGACSNNPGKGGLAALMKYMEHTKIITGYLPLTTNNQMELIAPILALRSLKKKSSVKIYTDSKYVQNGITSWIHSWKAKNWLTDTGKTPLKNVKLWLILDKLNSAHQVEWLWVKGHSGHPENEQVDALAKKSIIDQAPLLEEFLFLSNELKV